METAALGLPLLIALVAIALLFDFLNGMNDAGNSIATIVSTRVLKPQYAVAWAAFFNFIAFLFFGLHVAQTLGTGIIDATIVDPRVVFGALTGAIVWNLITWGLGIPSSSSHALVGGLLGAGCAKAGISAIVWPGVIKTGAAIVLSPLVGFVLAILLVFIVSWIFVRSTPYAVDNLFRSLQFVSASLYSLGHGRNDAQKTMGSKITRLTPVQGFCAETGGAITLFVATWLGIPVSTTHTITGAIVGVGAARRVSAVRWNVASNIVVAWIITIPASAAMAALAYYMVGWFARGA